MVFPRKLFQSDHAAGSAAAATPDPAASEATPPTRPTPDPAASEAAPTIPPLLDAADAPPTVPPLLDTPPQDDAIAAPPTPNPADAWWTSAAPEGDAPPSSQSSTTTHSVVAPATPAPNEDEQPTEPFSLIEIAQVRAQMEAEMEAEQAAQSAAQAAAPMEGTRHLDESSAPALSPRRSAQGLAAMAARDIGRVRELNQDSIFAMITTLPREGSDISVGLFIVADGMGGHDGGEIASRLAVRTVVYQVLSQLVLPALDDTQEMALQQLMVSAVQDANETIWNYARSTGSDMGTTCTTALLVGHGLYVAHVGDSRAYLYEPGGLKQLTSDHSTVGRLIQLGQLDPSEAREHPLRNQLYRTVGQQPQVMVDFFYHNVGAGSHLLLCSDGLWGMVSENHMEQALGRSPWPQDACNELIALANLAGGEDNIAAVVVSLPIAER